MIPFATGGGVAYRAGNRLVDVANTADNLVVSGGSAATRGTKVHTQFDNLIDTGAAGRSITGETAYVNGQVIPQYRSKGSSNPDAVLGNIDNPTAAFDLKTGQSGISNSQAARYEANLPDGTPVYTVRPTGHDVPVPQSMSGFGAGLNTGYLAGDALFGDSTPYSSGGFDSFIDPTFGK